jgi:hypothetical protein
MLNKLRLSTAIVGSLAGLSISVAVAQTTISGNIAIGYMGTSSDSNSGGSWDSMTKETQINIANKGKLNNGMDYAAGFSIEMDGGDSNVDTGAHTEGNYIELISGQTTFLVGADRVQNGDGHMTNAVGIGYIAQDGLGSGADNTQSIYPLHGSIYQNFGAGLTQKVGNGAVSIFYAPKMTNVTLNDIGNGATAAKANATSAGNRGKGYEIGYKGDLNVKGLAVKAFKTSGDRIATATGANKEVKSTNLGLAYTVGQITVSAEQLKTEGVQGGILATANVVEEELKGRAVGIAYAATKDLSFGLTYGKAESDNATSVNDEKTTIVAVGYSLGPVALKAQVAKVDDYQGIAGTDGKTLRVLLSTNF